MGEKGKAGRTMIERLFEPAMDPRTEAEIAALIERTYINVDFAGRSFFQQRHHLRLLARAQDGTLAAHMAVLFRVVRLGDTLLDIFGTAVGAEGGR